MGFQVQVGSACPRVGPRAALLLNEGDQVVLLIFSRVGVYEVGKSVSGTRLWAGTRPSFPCLILVEVLRPSALVSGRSSALVRGAHSCSVLFVRRQGERIDAGVRAAQDVNRIRRLREVYAKGVRFVDLSYPHEIVGTLRVPMLDRIRVGLHLSFREERRDRNDGSACGGGPIRRCGRLWGQGGVI